MTSSTALTQATEPAPRAVASLAGGMVAAIVPKTFDDVYRFAQVVSQSGLCPYGMDTPQKVTVAILTGLEVGAKPMQAVQGIAVIGGRPCIWGDLALGLVRGSGELEWIKEFYEGDEDAVDWTAAKPSGAALKFKAVCIVKRKGEPETRNEFSIGDAVVAKLWGKRGHNGKDTPWITNPKRMLKMRSRGFGLRDQFTDVLKGLYIAEELIGTDVDQPDNGAPVPTAPPPPPAPNKPAEIEKPEPQVPDSTVQDAEYVETRSQEEAFDAEEWLDDAAAQFAGCKTPQDVDDAHEVFSDTMETMLTREQRERYQAMHMEAAQRLEQAAAAGAIEEPPPEAAPPPAAAEKPAPTASSSLDDDEDETKVLDKGALYLARGDAVLTDPNRTRASIAEFWRSTKDERLALKKAGHLSAEASTALNNRLKAVDAELAKAEQQADDEDEAPEPAAPPAGDDPVAKFDREYRAKIASIQSVTELHQYVESTLKRRNELANGDQKLINEWRGVKVTRQNQLNGIA